VIPRPNRVKPNCKCGAPKHVRASGVRTDYCKDCLRTNDAAWVKANAARVRESKKAWQATKGVEYFRRRHALSDRGLAAAQRRAARVPRDWKAYNRAYYLAHREEHRAHGREWKKNNRLKVRLDWYSYRARLMGAAGSHTPEELLQRLDEQCGLCAYCLKRMFDRWQTEHVIALAAGGTNDIDNIVLACGSCNGSKAARSILAFLPVLERSQCQAA